MRLKFFSTAAQKRRALLFAFLCCGVAAPAQALPIGFCQAECQQDHADDPAMASFCELQCREDGGGGNGGGGGGRRCRPSCGPCNPDPDKPGAGSRTCLQANCDTRDIACKTTVRPPHPGKITPGKIQPDAN